MAALFKSEKVSVVFSNTTAVAPGVFSTCSSKRSTTLLLVGNGAFEASNASRTIFSSASPINFNFPTFSLGAFTTEFNRPMKWESIPSIVSFLNNSLLYSAFINNCPLISDRKKVKSNFETGTSFSTSEITKSPATMPEALGVLLNTSIT